MNDTAKAVNEATKVAFAFLRANPDGDEFIKRGVRAGLSDVLLEGRICDEIKQPAVAVAMVDWLTKQEVINTRTIANTYILDCME